MRRLVLILVLANLLMFGWNRGWFDAAVGPSTGVEENARRLRPVPLSRLEPPRGESPAASAPKPRAAQPQAQQPTPSQSLIAPPPAAQPLAAPVPGSASAQQPGSASSPQPGSAATPQSGNSAAPRPGSSATTSAPGDSATPPLAPNAAPEPAAQAAAPSALPASVACRAFPPIDEDRAVALRSALEQSGARVDARRIEQGASYLVYLPPAASLAEAQQRLAELRRIGRDDAFVIQDGPLRLAISLGLFRFESAARSMLDQLARAGETRAQVAPRPPIQVRIALQARWPRAEAAAIATMLGAQFDAPARDCE